jgi:hypothetical protein
MQTFQAGPIEITFLANQRLAVPFFKVFFPLDKTDAAPRR